MKNLGLKLSNSPQLNYKWGAEIWTKGSLTLKPMLKINDLFWCEFQLIFQWTIFEDLSHAMTCIKHFVGNKDTTISELMSNLRPSYWWNLNQWFTLSKPQFLIFKRGMIIIIFQGCCED